MVSAFTLSDPSAVLIGDLRTTDFHNPTEQAKAEKKVKGLVGTFFPRPVDCRF